MKDPKNESLMTVQPIKSLSALDSSKSRETLGPLLRVLPTVPNLPSFSQLTFGPSKFLEISDLHSLISSA
jgi:hypothetical protein